MAVKDEQDLARQNFMLSQKTLGTNSAGKKKLKKKKQCWKMHAMKLNGKMLNSKMLNSEYKRALKIPFFYPCLLLEKELWSD